MSDFLPFVISGLTVGAIYGLSATGLVLTYKTSGIFNFAHPALAALAAYVFFYLHIDNVTPGPRLPWPVAALVAVGVLGPLMGLGMELIARGLARVATSLQILATTGLALGIIGGLGLLYKNNGTLGFPQFLPSKTFGLLGTDVSYAQLILFLFSLVVAFGLYGFFRFSRSGMQMRAVVENPPLLDVMGTSPNRVRRRAWIIGATFAAASGVLLGPIVAQLQASGFLLIVISSFGAAAIGGFSSLPLTFVGGLVMGVLGDLSTKYVSDVSWLQNFNDALPFIILFVVLIVVKPSRLRERRVEFPRPLRESYYAPPRVRVVFAVVILGVFLLVPTFVGNNLSIWLSGITYMILVLSLGLLVKLSGQVSLCQTVLAAVGGSVLAHAADDWHLPWLLCVLLAGLVTMLVGGIIAIPAIRVSGVFLALATFGFGYFMQQMIYPTKLMFGAGDSGLPAPRPSFAESDKSYYYLLLGFLVVISLLMVVIHYGRLGRLARALRDSPVALNSSGTTVTVLLITVFAISAFLAGVAGALYSSASVDIFVATPLFDPGLSLDFFAVVMLIAAGIPWYGILGGLALEVLPGYIGQWFQIDFLPYLSLIFAVSAVAVAVTAGKNGGLPKALIAFYERFRRPRAEMVIAGVSTRQAPAGSALEIRDVTVRYGGFIAVDSVSLSAPFGTITGLLGPNGAGKTSLFNAISGMVNATHGEVLYDGAELSRLSIAARSRRGLGRTFQLVQLCSSLSVEENVALGREASLAGANALKQILATPGEPQMIRRATAEALRLTDSLPLAARIVSGLSTGERRLVELARVLAGPFDLLLLDEPSSGLDSSQTRRFGELLRQAVTDRQIGILLVEHDMSLVSQVCDNVYLMDFGRLIFEGTSTELTASEVVRNAYLGTGLAEESRDIAVSEVDTVSGPPNRS